VQCLQELKSALSEKVSTNESKPDNPVIMILRA
jgi:hypothetical protein